MFENISMKFYIDILLYLLCLEFGVAIIFAFLKFFSSEKCFGIYPWKNKFKFEVLHTWACQLNYGGECIFSPDEKKSELQINHHTWVCITL